MFWGGCDRCHEEYYVEGFHGQAGESREEESVAFYCQSYQDGEGEKF